MVDDFCRSHASKRNPGPEASLCYSEIITLAIFFARWNRFASERVRLRPRFHRRPTSLAETFFALRSEAHKAGERRVGGSLGPSM